MRGDPELIMRNDGPFKQDLDRYKYPERHESDPLEHRERGLAFLRELDERLAEQCQLGGAVRGLADAAIMPFVRQFSAVDAAWFEDQSLPYLRRWLVRHLGSDLFETVMTRFSSWHEGDAPIFFPSSAEFAKL